MNAKKLTPQVVLGAFFVFLGSFSDCQGRLSSGLLLVVIAIFFQVNTHNRHSGVGGRGYFSLFCHTIFSFVIPKPTCVVKQMEYSLENDAP